MKSRFCLFFIVFLLYLTLADRASANDRVVEPSAQLEVSCKDDYRVLFLKNFLAEYNSPLSIYSEKLIFEADKNNLDWRLVAAISGVESTFGKKMPKNSFNAYGWDNGEHYFESWEKSIEVVSKTLNKKYLQKGALSVRQIGRIYAPGNRMWPYKVKFFISKIDPLPVTFDLGS